MIQGAVDSRILATTDNCTSRTVEEALSRALTRALYHQANSSVFYESRYSCGVSLNLIIYSFRGCKTVSLFTESQQFTLVYIIQKYTL